MKIARILLLAASVLLLWASPAKADTVSVITGSGTWGDGTPLTPESAPGVTWSFSFTVPNPVTDAIDFGGQGHAFQTEQVSGFSYLLNGAPVAATLLNVVFFDAEDFGLFDLHLSDGNVVSLFGTDSEDAQLYTGNPPPVMSFINDTTFSADASMNDADPTGGGTVKITSMVVPTPEPATVSLLGMALFGLLLTRIYKG